MPFLFQKLEIKLLGDNEATNITLQKNENALQNIMDRFSGLYESTDNVIDTIHQAVNSFETAEYDPAASHAGEIQESRDVPIPSPILDMDRPIQRHNGRVNFFMREPQSYLRLAVIVECSFSHQRLPDEEHWLHVRKKLSWADVSLAFVGQVDSTTWDQFILREVESKMWCLAP